MPGAVRIRGDLDVRALKRAFEAIVDRHETLRTVFQAQEGQPYQVIRQERHFDYEELELTGLDGSKQEQRVQAAIMAAHVPLLLISSKGRCFGPN